ncbi:MAG: ubiquinol-cytochrome c reductase iron-sulfur subunit [Longimicrobiales bacterium]
MTDRVTRRTFVKRLPVLGAAASLAASSGCASLRYAIPREDGDRIAVGRAEFDTGDYVLVETTRSSRPLYVHRGEDGDFTAVLAECTHRQCQPEPQGDRLACPCHGSEFSHSGEVLQGPADRSLPRFEVEATADTVTVWWSRRTG